MATTQTNTIQPSNNTDALFRAWVAFVLAAFTNAGWVQTTDTGQIDATTVTKPTAINQDRGVALFRMSDSLQATRPIYVILTFGSGAATNDPRLGIGIGTGSTGAGSLTGGLGSRTIRTLSNSTAQTSVFTYSSGANNRIHIMLFDDAVNSNFCMNFSIERGRDSSGNIDGNYVYFISSSTGGNVGASQVFHTNGGSHGIAQAVLCCIVPPTSQRAMQEDYGVGLVLPIGASAVVMRPATGYLVTPESDFLNGAVLTMYVHGLPVSYRRTQNCRPLIGTGVVATHQCWIRFD